MGESLCDIVKEHEEGLISLRMVVIKLERYAGDGVAGDKETAIYVLESHEGLHALMKEKWYGIKGSAPPPPLDDIDCPSDGFHDLTAPTIMGTNEGEARRLAHGEGTTETTSRAEDGEDGAPVQSREDALVPRLRQGLGLGKKHDLYKM